MNIEHLKSFVGIVKIVALIISLIAACLGTAAFSLSPYNKSCRDGDEAGIFLPSTANSSQTETTQSSSTISSSSTVESTISTISSTISALQDTSETTTLVPEDKDMAPVLWMERFQISCTWMATMISIILLVLYIVKEDLEYSKYFKAVNFVFHFVFAVLLIVAAICMSYAAIEIDRQICQPSGIENREDCQKYVQKMNAAGFTFLAGVLYAVISGRILLTKLYTQV